MAIIVKTEVLEKQENISGRKTVDRYVLSMELWVHLSFIFHFSYIFFWFCEDRQEKEKSGEIAFALLMFHRDLSTTQQGDFAGPTISLLCSHINLEPWAIPNKKYRKQCFSEHGCREPTKFLYINV